MLTTSAAEELDTKLVLHDSVLGLATSVDRVLRQRQGHLLLIGASGSGRTTVTRFVAWLVGLSVFTIAPSRKYGMAEFDEDLRTVLRRAGTQGEKICFIIDEAQIKSPAFLERMNSEWLAVAKSCFLAHVSFLSSAARQLRGELLVLQARSTATDARSPRRCRVFSRTTSTQRS